MLRNVRSYYTFQTIFYICLNHAVTDPWNMGAFINKKNTKAPKKQTTSVICDLWAEVCVGDSEFIPRLHKNVVWADVSISDHIFASTILK